MRNLVEKQLSWLALIVTAFYSLLGSCRSADTSEECGHERLVKCGIPLERINSDAMRFASSKENLRVLCSDLESSMKCIQTYTLDCLEMKQRTHFHNLLASTNKLVMELCHDGPYQDEFLKHTPCMKKVQPQYELCNKRYQRTAHEIERSNFTSQSGYLKNICCAFKEYLACSYHTVRRQCGEDTAHFTKEFLDKMSGTLIRVHCEPYTEEVCAIGSGAGISSMLTIVPVALVLLTRYFT
ncbi:uncharacterized protein LOC116431232 [Nomia melanderi]|uniref:uncharacterized protein LOC116431232 n=1 Tax=Nomia melanderi TaxID=2448451 RepID=UPI001304534F|nr:uncharacterized protein LOC116431232 [Nomia melanderi]